MNFNPISQFPHHVNSISTLAPPSTHKFLLPFHNPFLFLTYGDSARTKSQWIPTSNLHLFVSPCSHLSIFSWIHSVFECKTSYLLQVWWSRSSIGFQGLQQCVEQYDKGDSRTTSFSSVEKNLYVVSFFFYLSFKLRCNFFYFKSPEEISSMDLHKTKETAEACLGIIVNNAVVTVPAYFNDSVLNIEPEEGFLK